MTRRGFLGMALASSCLGQIFPGEARRYADASTEFLVYRLTDPQHASYLPAAHGRALTRRGDQLLYASERTGTLEAYLMDIKSGQSRRLTQAEALRPDTLTLLPDGRSFLYFDGARLRRAPVSGGRARSLYQAQEGYRLGQGFSISAEGTHAAFVERREGRNRLRLVWLSTGEARTLFESEGVVDEPLLRPRRNELLYRLGGDAAWLVSYDGRQRRRLALEPGEITCPRWSSDGRTLLYLNEPRQPGRLVSLREYVPESGEDKLVAATSQYAGFGANRESTVFVGASRSKASPYVLLLVRAGRREMTLCEHRASDPSKVAPLLSPDSQRVYFQSDKDGKLAIYSIPVERLLEQTEG